MSNFEKRPEQPAAPQETVPGATEEVVGEFARVADDYRGHLDTEDDRNEAFTKLHRILDKFDNHPLKMMYDEGRMPTIDSLDRTAKSAARILYAENNPDATRIAKLLESHIVSVKRWCRQYVTSLLKFRRAKLARFGDHEQLEEFEKADSDRRRIHNALLSSLATLNDLLREGKEYGDIEEPMQWDPTQELPPGVANTQEVIFSPKALQDRDSIRDWAIVADRIEEIRKITGHTEPAEK